MGLSLFDDLPAPQRRPRPQLEEGEQYRPAPAPAEEARRPPVVVEPGASSSEDEDEDEEAEERPGKRARHGGHEEEGGLPGADEQDDGAGEEDEDEAGRRDAEREAMRAAGGAAGPAAAPGSPPGLPADQVAAALKKIAAHVGNPDKFAKASALFRQLLDGGSLGRQHRDDAFEVVKAAFSDFDNASEASLRRDYMRLCHALDKHQELFSRPQRVQLEVYRIVGFLQNELHTDDSFVLNKALTGFKAMVDALPEAGEEDEEALEQLQDPEVGAAAAAAEAARQAAARQAAAEAEARRRQQEEEERAARRQRQEEEEREARRRQQQELDPFGLDSLLEAPAPRRPKAPPSAPALAPAPLPPLPPSNAWTPAQALVMRRQALIECLITTQSLYKLPWARTSVELAVEHYVQRRDRFTGAAHRRGVV